MPDYEDMPKYVTMVKGVLTGLKVNQLEVSRNTYAGMRSMPT
jgi:hypothetical protein